MKPNLDLAQPRILENQPAAFPRLFFIPATASVPDIDIPANDPVYHHSPCPVPVGDNPVQRFIRQEKELLLQLVSEARAAIIAATRATIRWLFWHVAVPLAVIGSLYTSFANPAELPL
jgi:hypothetical protein